GDTLLLGHPADLAGEVDVAFGHRPDVVADEAEVDVRVAEGDVRVVVGPFGELGDRRDEPQAGGEVAGAEAGVQPPREHAPVGEVGVEDLLTGEPGHGPQWHGSPRTTRARPPDCGPRVWGRGSAATRTCVI